MHVVMIHGGLWENMDAHRFWRRPGIVADLRAAGHTVDTPDRLRHPPSWGEDTAHIAATLPHTPVALIAGSNGCTIAARLAHLYPHAIARLLFAWPATCGNETHDGPFRQYLSREGACDDTIADLTTGDTLRGVTDSALAATTVPVSVIAAPRTSPQHQPHTARRVAALTRAHIIGTYLEPPAPGFAAVKDDFVATVLTWLDTGAAT